VEQQILIVIFLRLLEGDPFVGMVLHARRLDHFGNIMLDHQVTALFHHATKRVDFSRSKTRGSTEVFDESAQFLWRQLDSISPHISPRASTGIIRWTTTLLIAELNEAACRLATPDSVQPLTKRHAGSLLSYWLGFAQVGLEPHDSHPLGNTDLFPGVPSIP
jgi:hypothetical protein